MGSSFLMMMVFALGGGSAGDLLDFAPTDAYWQMRDQRVVDVATMSGVLADAEAAATDKLMAIRALGELGQAENVDKAAVLAVLGPLVDSNEPFVGQYAKRSIAWVKGEAPEPRPVVPPELMQADLALLPPDCTIVGQMRVDNGIGPIDLAKLIPDFRMEHGPSRAEMMQELTGVVLQGIEAIGNARVDAVTLGVAWQDDDDGPVTLIARGQYDRINVMLLMEQLAEEEGGNENLSMYSIGETEVIAFVGEWEQFVLIMPSDELFIFLFSEGGRDKIKLPIDQTAQRVEQGNAQPTFNETITAQIGQIDRENTEVWLAMQFVPLFKQHEMEEAFGPFDAGHAQAIKNDAGDIIVTWAAEGEDADAIAEAVAFMNEGIAEGRREIREEMRHNPEMKPLFGPMVEIMDSLHIEADDTAMTGGLTLPGGIGGVMPMMFGMSMPRQHHAVREQAAGVVVEEAAEAVEAAE